MKPFHLARERLRSQLVTHTLHKKPSDIVRWFGAVQAQDYLGALWAVGLRTGNASEAQIEQALANREIVRTWPMRGTLHFVAPEDVRWMLGLLTPRIIVGNATRLARNYELTDKVLGRAKDAFIASLHGEKQLSRAEMYSVLEKAQISTAHQRGLHVLWRLAQDGVICFGVRQGKQQRFVLLDEWVPGGKTLEREEALAELAARYFASHGPATLGDFGWWSGLAKADASLGLELAKRGLAHAEIEDEVFWFSSDARPRPRVSQKAFLLPAYDESTVGYSDRTALFDAKRAHRVNRWNSLVLSPTIVIDNRIVGTWKRTVEKSQVVVRLNLFAPLSRTEKRACAAALDRYAAFLQMPVVLAG